MVTSYTFSIADPVMYLHTAPTISAATSATASPATRETDTTAKVSSRNTSNWPDSSLYWDQIFLIKFITAVHPI